MWHIKYYNSHIHSKSKKKNYIQIVFEKLFYYYVIRLDFSQIKKQNYSNIWIWLKIFSLNI